ncbi:right-handed parallel beta-helix repeat-containing protein [Hyalangium rubrum]|uniref:Right-handed parallel beta-helix repeat-containing protein n=1 Tax=Hyalangium rubrum TaxID=3103134 RepID=A0ABU5GYK6_9BACT|nr:right-handed parallel beta-helix repeat-containing protein [Hyalangium sp. s54d21]MDY7224920.1 right-handed parallel beta-helix repeat-containing protein [Hyalangium sp. s54d21]
MKRGAIAKQSLTGACGVFTCLLMVACEQGLPAGELTSEVNSPRAVQSPSWEAPTQPVPVAQPPLVSQPGPEAEAPEAEAPEAAPPAQAPQPPPPASQPPAPPPPTQPQAPEPTGQSWFVSPSGSQGGRGTRASPLKTLSQAVAAARPGDTIRVLPGVYSEQLTLESRGANAAAITIRGEGTPLPTIVPSSTRRSAVIIARGRYHLENLHIDLGGAAMAAVVFERTASNSRLIGSELHGGTAGAGVLVSGAANITIENNTIHHFIKPRDDSHGVLVVGPSRKVTIRGNDIHDNSGDSVQCQASGDQPADEVMIEGNTLHDEGENAVDIKRCHRVTVRNNEMSGFPNTARRPGGSSAGEAVVIHEAARTIVIQGNLISQAGRGVSVVGGSAIPEDLRILGNTIQDIRNVPAGNGQGIRIEVARNVQVADNVIQDTASYGLMVAADGKVVSGLTVRYNTLRGGPQQLLLRLGHELHRPGSLLRGNRYRRGGILKGDGVAEKLGGVHAPYRGKFSGEQLTLSSSEKLEAWRSVLGVDQDSWLQD